MCEIGFQWVLFVDVQIKITEGKDAEKQNCPEAFCQALMRLFIPQKSSELPLSISLRVTNAEGHLKPGVWCEMEI